MGKEKNLLGMVEVQAMGVDHARANSTGEDGSGEGGNDTEDRELIENMLPGEELKRLDLNQTPQWGSPASRVWLM